MFKLATGKSQVLVSLCQIRSSDIAYLPNGRKATRAKKNITDYTTSDPLVQIQNVLEDFVSSSNDPRHVISNNMEL